MHEVRASASIGGLPYALSLILVHVAACAAPERPPVAIEPAPLAASSYLPPPPCRTEYDCLAKGKTALEANQEDARNLLVLACKKRSAEGCLELGKAYATGKGGPEDRHAALNALGRICRDPGGSRPNTECSSYGLSWVSSTTCVADACAWLAELSPSDTSDYLLYAERGCSEKGQQEPESSRIRSKACMAAAKAQEAAKQIAEARRRYQTACALGDAEGCKIALQMPAPPEPAAPSGSRATVKMKSTDVGGLVIRDISCEIDDGPIMGILGGMMVGAGFGGQKATLRQCSPRPFETKIHWVARGNRVIEVTSDAPDATVRACVEEALLGTLSVPTVSCTGTLVVDSAPTP